MAESQVTTDLDINNKVTDLTKQNVTTNLKEQNITTEFTSEEQKPEEAMQEMMQSSEVQKAINDPAIQDMMKGMNTEQIQMTNVMMGKDMDDFGGIVAGFSFFIFLFSFVAYILASWGLWKLAKKLNEPYPWMAWVPYIQIYTIVKVGGKSGIWVLYLIVGLFLFFIPGIIILFLLCLGLARRLGRGVGTAILTLLFSWIMYPYLATRSDSTSSKNMGNTSLFMKFGSLGVTPLETKSSEEVKVELTPQVDSLVNSETPSSTSDTVSQPNTKI